MSKKQGKAVLVKSVLDQIDPDSGKPIWKGQSANLYKLEPPLQHEGLLNFSYVMISSISEKQAKEAVKERKGSRAAEKIKGGDTRMLGIVDSILGMMPAREEDIQAKEIRVHGCFLGVTDEEEFVQTNCNLTDKEVLERSGYTLVEEKQEASRE